MADLLESDLIWYKRRFYYTGLYTCFVYISKKKNRPNIESVALRDHVVQRLLVKRE